MKKSLLLLIIPGFVSSEILAQYSVELRQGAGATQGLAMYTVSCGTTIEALFSYRVVKKIYLKGGVAYFTQQEKIKGDGLDILDKATLNYSFLGPRFIISIDGTYYDHSKTRFYLYGGYQASKMIRNHSREFYHDPEPYVIVRNLVEYDNLTQDLNSKIINSIIAGLDISHQFSSKIRFSFGPYFIHTFADDKNSRYWWNLGGEFGMSYALKLKDHN